MPDLSLELGLLGQGAAPVAGADEAGGGGGGAGGGGGRGRGGGRWRGRWWPRR